MAEDLLFTIRGIGEENLTTILQGERGGAYYLLMQGFKVLVNGSNARKGVKSKGHGVKSCLLPTAGVGFDLSNS